MKKQPEKTARTRKRIIDAFWDLAKTAGIYGVTVSAITKQVGLNRCTFYTYFSDTADLLRQAEAEIIHDFQNQMLAFLAQKGKLEMSAVSGKVVEFFALYDDKVFLLLGKSGDPNFLSLVREEAAKIYTRIFSAMEPIANPDYIIAYTTSALTGLLTYWHDTGRRIPLEELMALSRTLAVTGILGAMEL